MDAAAFRIPVVDFDRFKNATSPDQKQQTADEIVSAFKEVGFVYLSGHGIPEATVQHVFRKVSIALGVCPGA